MWDFDTKPTRRDLNQTARQALTDTAQCLRFYSRLPLPALPWEAHPNACPDFRTAPGMLPAAGAMIGLIGAAVLIVALALDLDPWLAAALAVATLTLVTGALHEDGLADTADGFGGGATPEQRLAIMRDSRIGSFGASALILAFALRIGALASLADRLDPLGAASALVLAAMLSRTAGLILMTRLPPARPDGAAQAVGQPSKTIVATACALAGVLALVLSWIGALPLAGLPLAAALVAVAVLTILRLAEKLIGGQTGDVMGAAQQVAEIAAMLGILIAVRS